MREYSFPSSDEEYERKRLLQLLSVCLQPGEKIDIRAFSELCKQAVQLLRISDRIRRGDFDLECYDCLLAIEDGRLPGNARPHYLHEEEVL